MVFRGVLIPETQVNRLMKVYELLLKERSDERDEWKAAWLTSQEGIALLAQQNQELLEVGRTSEKILKSLENAADSNRKGLPNVGT